MKLIGYLKAVFLSCFITHHADFWLTMNFRLNYDG